MSKKKGSSTRVAPRAAEAAVPTAEVGSPWERLAMGIVVAAVLAAALSIFRPAGRSSDGSSTFGGTNAPTNAAVDAPAPVLSPEAWRDAFPLEPAEIHLSAAELKATEQTPGLAAAAALNRALESYRAADYQKASADLEAVLNEHPDEYRAALYLGVTRLFLDEPPAALEVLRQAEQSADTAVRADTAWYTLVGIARLREPDQAGTDAAAQCSRDPQAAARQCRAVEALARARAATR